MPFTHDAANSCKGDVLLLTREFFVTVMIFFLDSDRISQHKTSIAYYHSVTSRE